VTEKKYDFDFRWKDASGKVIDEKTSITEKETPELWENVPEAFRSLVSDGSIVASVGYVTASAKIEENGKKAEKQAIDSYVRLNAETPQAALALMGNRMKANDDGAGVLTRFNYGYDLSARGDKRNPLLQKLEGPEKAIERAVKGLMGIPGMTEAKARKIVADNPPEA